MTTKKKIIKKVKQAAKKAVRREVKRETKHTNKPSVRGRGNYVVDFGKKLGGMGGSKLGSMIPIPGLNKVVGGIGSYLGGKLGGLFSKITGLGDYRIQNGTLNEVYNDLIQTHGNNAAAYMNSSVKPTIQLSDKHPVFECSELIGEVLSSQAFNMNSYIIDPSNTALFKQLGVQSQLFSKYQFLQCFFEFRSTCGIYVNSNPAIGTVAMATQYNVSDPAFASYNDLVNHSHSNVAKPTESSLHGIECAPGYQVTKWKFIAESGDQADPNLAYHGRFNIATMGQQTDGDVIGQLWFHCKVVFDERRYPHNFGIFANGYSQNLTGQIENDTNEGVIDMTWAAGSNPSPPHGTDFANTQAIRVLRPDSTSALLVRLPTTLKGTRLHVSCLRSLEGVTAAEPAIGYSTGATEVDQLRFLDGSGAAIWDGASCIAKTVVSTVTVTYVQWETIVDISEEFNSSTGYIQLVTASTGTITKDTFNIIVTSVPSTLTYNGLSTVTIHNEYKRMKDEMHEMQLVQAKLLAAITNATSPSEDYWRKAAALALVHPIEEEDEEKEYMNATVQTVRRSQSAKK